MTPRISEKDAHGLKRLFVAVAPELRRFASKLVQGDYASADDLVQDVFHDAALAWHTLGGCDIDHQRAWLFAVLKNKAISRWKANSRVDMDLGLDVSCSNFDDTFDKALTSIALERCWEALKGMPTARYRVAYLRWHEQWSTTEIAQFLGIEKSTVRVHLKNARDGLVAVVGSDISFAEDPEASVGEHGEEAAS